MPGFVKDFSDIGNETMCPHRDGQVVGMGLIVMIKVTKHEKKRISWQKVN